MPTMPRIGAGGIVYHALNRANERATLFGSPGDYLAFEEVLREAKQRHPEVEIFSFCIMPNHWHFALRTERDGVVSDFMHWLTTTHAKRWRAFRRSEGHGHLYQGRFKSFPVQDDAHFLTLCRYIERNPLRANLVQQAEHWRWSSLWYRLNGSVDQRSILSPWPVPQPHAYLEWVNTLQSSSECEEIRTCVARGIPFGDPAWSRTIAEQLGILVTPRPRGRPRK